MLKNSLNKEVKNFTRDISVREEIENQNRKKLIAQKLINKEISIYDLEDKEINEMTEYFITDIEKLDKEIIKVKEHILKMKKELNNQ